MQISKVMTSSTQSLKCDEERYLTTTGGGGSGADAGGGIIINLKNARTGNASMKLMLINDDNLSNN